MALINNVHCPSSALPSRPGLAVPFRPGPRLVSFPPLALSFFFFFFFFVFVFFSFSYPSSTFSSSFLWSWKYFQPQNINIFPTIPSFIWFGSRLLFNLGRRASLKEADKSDGVARLCVLSPRAKEMQFLFHLILLLLLLLLLDHHRSSDGNLVRRFRVSSPVLRMSLVLQTWSQG